MTHIGPLTGTSPVAYCKGMNVEFSVCPERDKNWILMKTSNVYHYSARLWVLSSEQNRYHLSFPHGAVNPEWHAPGNTVPSIKSQFSAQARQATKLKRLHSVCLGRGNSSV